MEEKYICNIPTTHMSPFRWVCLWSFIMPYLKGSELSLLRMVMILIKVPPISFIHLCKIYLFKNFSWYRNKIRKRINNLVIYYMISSMLGCKDLNVEEIIDVLVKTGNADIIQTIIDKEDISKVTLDMLEKKYKIKRKDDSNTEKTRVGTKPKR